MGQNRTVGLDGLRLVVIAGRACRVDTDMVEGDYPELMVTVYDAATGMVIATMSDAMGCDDQLLGLEMDVNENGW